MSKLYVNELAPKTSGGVITGASNVLEMIPMLCDGESYTGISGTYTTSNVTAVQNLTTTYADITGSSISYTPPTGTVAVIYEYYTMISYVDKYAAIHAKFLIDGTWAEDQRRAMSYDAYPEDMFTFKFIIPIGGTADSGTGRQSSWTSAKTLKLQMREYGSNNEAKLNRTINWDGATSAHTVKPSLTITAIGSAYNG